MAVTDIVLVQTTQTSTSTLSVGDYSKCGDLNTPEEGAGRTLQPNQYYFIRLNAAGLGWIDTGGFTKFGIRKAKDVDNDSTFGGSGSFEAITSEASNGDLYGPYLDIVDSFTPQDIESGGTEAAGGTGGEERDPGGQGIPGYVPGIEGTNPGGSSAGETALFFFAWLDS